MTSINRNLVAPDGTVTAMTVTDTTVLEGVLRRDRFVVVAARRGYRRRLELDRAGAGTGMVPSP